MMHAPLIMPAMSISVGELLAVPQLGLRLICPGGTKAMDRKIIWVHPTEVTDVSYSEPGEVLLSCGINFPMEDLSDPAEIVTLKKVLKSLGLPRKFDDAHEAYRQMWECYLSQLSQIGVLAFGFSAKIKHPSIPQALVEAARKTGMVLFEVPYEIPFAQISKVVSCSLEGEKDNLLRRTYVAQRRLISALSSTRPIRSVVASTAEIIGGWCAFVDVPSDNEGEVIAISKRQCSKQAIDWALRLMRKRNTSQSPWSVKTLFGLEDGRDCCVCVVSGEDADQRPLGVLVSSIAQPDESDMLLRSITMVAAEVLAVTLPRITLNDGHMRRLRAAAIDELAYGESRLVLTLAGELWSGVPQLPLAVICVGGETSCLDHCYTMLSTEQKDEGMGRGLIFGECSGHLWIVVSQDHAASTTAWLGKIRGAEYGTCEARSWQSVDDAFRKAFLNMEMFANVGYHRSVADLSPHELVSPRLASSFSSELLQPITELGGEESETLLRTLRKLLSCTFNVGMTAKRLEVHRHTVENRIAKMERLLGLDFTQETSRVKLYLACSFMRG